VIGDQLEAAAAAEATPKSFREQAGVTCLRRTTAWQARRHDRRRKEKEKWEVRIKPPGRRCLMFEVSAFASATARQVMFEVTEKISGIGVLHRGCRWCESGAMPVIPT